ncbi:reprolysin-like metallopeptidase [Sorangium sp. So ce1182]|uniref:reprolysin-like metallopeptidase n=1 Tax=Sorangium sp. So ce1182 TaxID=3133334 RepID=UPI003F5F0719
MKLNPVKSKLNGVDKVTGIKVELTTIGAGPTKATTTPQDAKIEFHERPGKGDTAKSNRLFATLAFKLKVDASGKNPELDGNYGFSGHSLTYEAFVRSPPVKFVSKGGGATSTSYEAPDTSSDFWLDLDLSAQGKNFVDSDILFLPWESETENNVIEIGAKLYIAGSVEADVNDNNVVTVPLEHKAVPEDGTGTAKFDCLGVGMVYPLDNALWTPGAFPGSKKAAKVVAASINVFLHDVLITKHTKATAPITLADVDTRLGKIFTDAGLPKPTVTQKTDADLTAAGFEIRTTKRGKRWAAKKALLGDPDSFMDTEGVSMGMFDFWFTFETALAAASAGEAAEAESISNFDPSTGTKLVLTPGSVIPQSVTLVHGCTAHPTLGVAEYPANMLTSTIAHEIGHALGLRHGLRATGSGYDIGPAGHVDISRGLMAYVSTQNGVCPLQFFGPVHRTVLAKRFK